MRGDTIAEQGFEPYPIICPYCFTPTTDPYTTPAGITCCWDCFNENDLT